MPASAMNGEISGTLGGKVLKVFKAFFFPGLYHLTADLQRKAQDHPQDREAGAVDVDLVPGGINGKNVFQAYGLFSLPPPLPSASLSDRRKAPE